MLLAISLLTSCPHDPGSGHTTMKQHDLWRNLFLGSALVLIAGLLPQPSQAGFQWVAPAETAAAPSVEVMPQPTMDAMPSLQPVPLQPRTQAVGRGQDVISPTIIEGAQPLPALAPVPLAAAPVPVTAVAPLSGGSEPLPIPAIEKPVDGFANNIPLAVALRQILPPDYSFSLAPDIDTATSVSWRGGAGWRDVLRSMLTNASLGFSEDGRAIRITRTSSFGAFAAAPPIAAPLPEPVVVSQPVAQVLPAQTVVLEQAPVAEGPIIDTWSAESGQSLRNVLEAWCQKTGIQLVWQAEYDYPLQASYSTTSTFEDAVRNLLLGFQEAQPQPYASLYNNPSVGQAVLVIEARGNNYSD
jgi:type IV pili sensor histidine kinase/response regulator